MRMSWPIVATACALLLAGCAGVPVRPPADSDSNQVSGLALKGIVHGGQGPLVGARVYLYATSSSGYGSQSTSLLTSVSGKTFEDSNQNYYVLSGTDGLFSITGDYTCPSGAQLYLYAIGGNPGAGDNESAGLLAGLGSCDTPNFTSLFIYMDEVSTVATAYAIAGFATDPTHVASSNTELAAVDIANAFGGIGNLETLSTGAANTQTEGGNGTVPQGEINTLANILAACINSDGSTGPGDPCGTLFTNAMNGTTEPTDTAMAAINIAHNPGLNIDPLWKLQTANAPFEPPLSEEPNDFTISITYSGGGLDGSGFAPEGIAVDGSGDVWVPNYNSGTLSEFNYLGVVPSAGTNGFGQGSLDNPTSVAIDPTGLISVANFNGNSLTEFYPSGAVKTKPQGSGLSEPYGIAIDSVDNVWVSNFGSNTLSEFQPSGAASSGSGGFGGVPAPGGIAADTAQDVWATDYGASTPEIVEASPNPSPGQPPIFTFVSEEQLNSPYGIAIDGSGYIWVTNTGGNGSISKFSSNGQVISPDPDGFTGGGLDDPYGIAIDGAGNVWTANFGGNANSISEFNSIGDAISGENGYVSNGLLEPYGIAIDGSGNVWVASDNTSGPLTEYVGAAVPVVTPISTGAAYKELGTMP